MLRGVVAMVKLQSGDNPALKTMADSLQLGGEGRTVAVAFAVPSEVFDALEAMRQKSGTRRGARRPAVSRGTGLHDGRPRRRPLSCTGETLDVGRLLELPPGRAEALPYAQSNTPYGFSSRSAPSASMKPAMACITGSDRSTNSMPVR